MRARTTDMIYYFLVFSVCLYFPFRIYRKVASAVLLRDETIEQNFENKTSGYLRSADGRMQETFNYSLQVSYLGGQLMRSYLRTGKLPPSGDIVKAYRKDGYDGGSIIFPSSAFFDAIFDERLMLYSAGRDGVYGSDDDIGVPLYSPEVDESMDYVKNEALSLTYLTYP